MPPGSDPQDVIRGITEEPESVQRIGYRSDTPIHYNGYGSHHLGRIHHMRHSNSVKNPTKINLDATTLD